MYLCSNCEQEVDLAADRDGGCLVLRQAGSVVAALCPKCTQNVQLAKVVIKRQDVEGLFVYAQYQPCISGS